MVAACSFGSCRDTFGFVMLCYYCDLCAHGVIDNVLHLGRHIIDCKMH
jgi:hypothetical protein